MDITLNTVIIDDCEDTRFVLRKILSGVPLVNIIGEADNGADGLSIILEKKPQLAFLDVQMPGMDGVEVAKKIAELNKFTDSKTYIIFATAFAQFAVDAFEYYAVDYLLKPYNLGRIETAINKVLERINPDRGIPEKRVLIKTDNGMILVNPADICFFTREGRGTYMYTTSSKIKVYETLDSLEKNLEDTPLKRSHRGYIVNLKRIRGIHPAGNKAYRLFMDGTDELAIISKNCFKEVQKLLGHTIKRDLH